MRLAVVADIHANRQALEAVVEEIEHAGADLVLCLGDIVGYNAAPNECIRRVREVSDLVIAGNHDRDTVSKAPDWGTNTAAREAQAWTREQLGANELSYLGDLPSHAVHRHGFVAAHGCYLNGTYVTGYVTSTMLAANLEVIESREDWPIVAFCGHTHAPLCGWVEGDVVREDRLERALEWPAAARAVLINPGSVGQPRDGDPRASFAIVNVENRSVEVRRVAYDIEGAARAIVAAGLPNSLADRLEEGR